jgi:hypothetical protein
VDIASEFLLRRSRYTVLARWYYQYNTLRFLYGQSADTLLERADPQVEDKSDINWDKEAYSSQEDEGGEGLNNHDGDDRRAPYGSGSGEEQAAGEG